MNYLEKYTNGNVLWKVKHSKSIQVIFIEIFI